MTNMVYSVMSRNNSYAVLVQERLAPLGTVRCQPMFGGHGVFLGEAMLGLILDDVLYLKTDQTNRADFEGAGLEPFAYTTKRGEVITSYHRAPAEAFDDWEALEPWVTGALDAASRSKAKKPAKSRARASSKA